MSGMRSSHSKERKMPSYVCPPVIRAFILHMVESYMPTLDLLLAEPLLRWRAFEMMVTLAFRPQKSKTIRFRSRSITGKIRNKMWEITLVDSVEQTTYLDAIRAITPGTLI